MTKLILAGRPLDISDIDLQLVYGVVSGLAQREANFSYTTDLQNTPELEKLIGELYKQSDNYEESKYYLHRGGTNILDTPPHPVGVRNLFSARIESHGVCVFEGLARITEANGRGYNWKYQIEFIGDNAAWILPAESLLFSSLKHDYICYDTSTVTDENEVFVFPFIEYGNFTNNMGPSLPLIDIENLYPALYVINLLKTGLRALGYDIINRVPELDALIIPFTNDKFVTIMGAMESVFATYTNETEFQIMSYLGSGNPNFLTNTNYQEIRFFTETDKPATSTVPSPGLVAPYINSNFSCGDVHLCFTLDYGFEYSDDPAASRTLIFTAQLVSSLDGVLVSNIDNIAAADAGVYNRTLEYCGVISFGADIFVRFTARAQAGAIGPILDTDFFVDIEYNNLKIAHSLSKENFLFNPYANAPNITLLELISNLSRMFNLVLTTERDTNRVIIETYNQYFRTIETSEARGVDWSCKLDKSSDVKITFPETRNVSFTYLNDSDMLSTSYSQANNGRGYGDYLHEVGGAGGDEEIKADKFATSQSTQILFAGTAYARNFDIITIVPQGASLPQADTTGWQSRILFYDKYSQLGEYWLLGSAHGTTTSLQLNFPLCYFAGQLGNLRFESLFNTNYQNAVVSFTQRRVLELVCVINENDVADLEFGRPHWILDRWCYLQKIIGWKPGGAGLARVVMREV